MTNFAELGNIGRPEVTSWIKEEGVRFSVKNTDWMVRHICLALGEIEQYTKLENADPDVASSLDEEKKALLELLMTLVQSGFLYTKHTYYETGVQNVAQANRGS